MSTYNASPGLSSRELGLLAEWERARKRWVTIEDIRGSAGAAAAAKVASALVRKTALVRVKPGVYLTRPLRLLKRRSAASPELAVEALLHGTPHYIGGLWAYTQNGLTQQQYVYRLDVFARRPHRPMKFGGTRILFRAVPSRSLDLGIVDTTIEGVSVPLSGPERTLVDLMEHPRMAGGVAGAVELFKRALPRVRSAVVADYAARLARTSTCQRIGLLLERAGAPTGALRSLAKRTARTRSLISLQPGARTGRVNRRWLIVENDHAVDAPATP